jgi:outer membrane protein OmpA-like peptidoglycan-associated protein
MQDGKIVANGIRFDVNKAKIKPESMGVINSIYSLLKDHPEVNLSVEGHTDSDGDDASNQSLSERRAKAVADQLVSMGIPASRLTSKGWGETKPVGANNTPEDKAVNRRVEFVKM